MENGLEPIDWQIENRCGKTESEAGDWIAANTAGNQFAPDAATDAPVGNRGKENI